jgi:hypothetical protein
MHLLVVANETVTGRKLIEEVERRKDSTDFQVTVIAPVSQPQRGYVVYEDTRRAAAGRRLDRTLSMLREEGISAHGLVVETDPVTARSSSQHTRSKSPVGCARTSWIASAKAQAVFPSSTSSLTWRGRQAPRTSSFSRTKRSWATRC